MIRNDPPRTTVRDGSELLAKDLDGAGPVGAERALGDDVQQLHPLDLAGAAQWAGIHRSHAAVPDELGDLLLSTRIVTGNKDIQRTAVYLPGGQRAGIHRQAWRAIEESDSDHDGILPTPYCGLAARPA